MDSDLAWVNGKSGRQSWRYADAFQRSIISEAILFNIVTKYGAPVAMWQSAGLAIVRFQMHIPPVASV